MPKKFIAKSPSGRYIVAKDLPDIKERLEAGGYTDIHQVSIPSVKTLEKYSFDGVCPTPVCRCRVEPDGYCQHGRPSWLILLSLI